MIARGRPGRSKAARLPRAIAPPTSSAEPAAPQFVARLVLLDPGFYTVSLASEAAGREPVTGLVLPAVQLCAAPRHESEGDIEITDSFGRAGSWLGDRNKVLFVKAPAGGGAALITGYLAGDPDNNPLELDIRRIAEDGSATLAAQGAGRQPSGRAPLPPLAPVTRLRMGRQGVAERSSDGAGIEVVAHIRGRGDVQFLDAPWVGRLGPGLWIEGFTVVPHQGLAAAAIEYKGLTTSGTETPWIGSGAFCGTRGEGIPLIGFAVRQKTAPGGAPLDCEYTGYFQSGATVGPTRNGAPCRSAIDHDALEGLQLHITPRPTGRASTA
jgi:hypothetical protein